MFIENKYYNWYMKIVSNAKLRTIDGYKENHHIIPKSLGGNNKKENIVSLTAREHYICHKLLIKITSGEFRKKMLLALWSFNRSSKNQQRIIVKSRDYELLRQQVSEYLSNSRKGIMNKGKKLSESHKKAISLAQKGKSKSEETKEKMKNSWKLRPPRSAEHCKALSLSGKGKTHSEDTKIKMSNSKKGKNPIHTQVTWVCIYCEKKGIGISNYNRWHGEQCRKKQHDS